VNRRTVVASGAATVGMALAGGAGAVEATWRMPDPGEITEIENDFIPTRDGERLAVQLWLPANAEGRPAPVVLEAIPYRKRDRYRAYGRFWGPTLARRGIAYARLDCRGSGDSTGLLEDEYLPREQLDAAEAIAWLAAQPWCNGAVGMRGVSWGGFLTLQTAARRPPALKAIMPMCASDRRYADDAHYVGGAFALTGLKWATSMRLVQAGPPDPKITGPGWKQAWLSRLHAAPPIAARWLSHPLEDDYWRQGSVAFDWSAIDCPTYVVGGLVDPYAPALPRLVANLTAPAKGLIGPWRHGYPLPASPGPALDWAFEEVRWWRHWLIGEHTGIMAEPRLRVFMPDATAAQVAPGPIPGRWIAEAAWPSPRVGTRTLHLADARLSDAPAPPAATHGLPHDAVVGLGKVEWCPFAPSELPREQSADDARSAVFDTEPAPESMEILGSPVARLSVASATAHGQVAARLCEVDPDGRSWLVAWGVLDLTRRQGLDHVDPLEPGRAYDVEVPLGFVAHRLAPGARLRLAVSAGLWPLVWPAGTAGDLTLHLAACRLELPVRTPPAAEAPMPIAQIAPMAEDPAAWPVLVIEETRGEIRVTETWPDSPGGSGPNIRLSMTAGDPSRCAWRAEQTSLFAWPEGRIALKASVTLTARGEAFHVEEETLATLDGQAVAHVRQANDVAMAG
jgi:putative CocE/NonD family hydrolase